LRQIFDLADLRLQRMGKGEIVESQVEKLSLKFERVERVGSNAEAGGISP
jgi:hypothetical protein